MNIYAISSFSASFLLYSLSIFIYLNNKKKFLNRIYALQSFVIASWILGCFGESVIKNYQFILAWDKLLNIFAIFSMPLFVHTYYAILGYKSDKHVKFFYILAIILVPLSFTPFYIKGVEYRYGVRFISDPGALYGLYIFGAIYGFSLSIIKVSKALIDADARQRLQLIYVLIATGFMTIAITIYLAMVLNIAISPLDNLLNTIYGVLIAYAIVRHQLMDIEVIIKKTLVFTGLFASVFAIVILPTLLIQEYILRSASSGGRLIGLTISGVIIILTMRRIETFLINITDKYLFQKKYDYKELLKTFTSEVLTVLELDNLVDLTVSKLTDIVKLNSCAVLLFDDEKQQFEVMASQNIKDPSVTLIRPDGIVTFMDETHGYVLVKELRDKKISIPSSIQEIIDKLNAELIIPMVMHNDVIGVLSLGKKKSDEEYTQDDMDILLPLARTLAIAISNAKLFVELGKTQAEAAQAEKMAVIGTLSAGINHEICNPLGIARGQCEAFLLNIKDGLYKQKTTEELLIKAKEIMAKVIHETDRATSITKKLSGFAKPSKGEMELVNVGKELDDVFGLVGYELKLEKIEFEKNIDEGLPNIFVDKKQFQEVLFNLIRNAGQAIGEKGKIAITAKQNKGRIFIDIKDSGAGIPEDKIKQLFNPFFTTKEPGKGTGLGLFIVRQVVEKNGGRINLKETKVGEGTTFTLEFPVLNQSEMTQAKKG